MRTVRRWSVVLALACFSSAPPLQANQLKVGISGSAPFVIEDGNTSSGISLDIWRRVAEDNNLSYTLIQQPSPQAGIEAVDKGRIDVLVGPISITSRRLAIPGIDFTQPYYLGKAGVLLPLNPPSILSRVGVFFGWAVMSSVLVLISVLLVVGSLIWMAERNHNSEQFPRAWLPGISSGMWFALVTLTTVGYGDKAPITRTGRGITGFWMVISLVAVSSLTASLASAFTLFLSGATETAISRPDQLNGRRIAVVEGTSGMELAQRGDMRIVAAPDLKGAIQFMTKKQADALIFDRPALRYHLKNNPDLALRLAPFTLAEETYGFVIKPNNPLRTPMDVSILRLQRRGHVEEIANRLLN
ncbi:ABC transporter substrate-binding protein [Synechococcus sp. KORDI-52]|uniref:transporter substrate-binding domain-containing protein n=1 Tax=Synechococcus sp. KORDI-52 TaxID=585425 RepID=UPI0004E07F7D|nr:transporter substrate-binding domain-containing protein [Synechococcus sp. KORDI-52]AII48851.1 ABC transporter substrate-binding protein [Synechococcus sp. KORDI-52]